MDTLKLLVKAGDHEGILRIESDEYNAYKVVAAIHLAKFNEALKYAKKNSYEHAYILYRQKRFRKALSIIRKNIDNKSSKKWEVLMAQCLYNLGYYADAYSLLSRHGKEDEYAVNLAAMEAMCKVSEQNKTKLSYFYMPFKGPIKNIVKLDFKDSECLLESKFNEIFKLVCDKYAYREALENLNTQYPIKGSCVDNQLKNMMGEECIDLSKKEKEVYEFNNGNSKAITHPAHFQSNFIEGSPVNKLITRYIDSFAASSNWSKNQMCIFNNIDLTNDILLLMKSHWAKYCMSDSSDRRRKWLEKCADSDIKDLMLLSMENFSDPAVQKNAIDLLLNFGKK